jgi:DNA-binding transcriptional MerR regulator/quercetin dioxygenase-like cupin family protein
MPQASYLTISEAARILGVSASSLRNWERIGLIRPVRSQGRYRLYSREVLAQAKQVQYLRKVKRLNPEGILHVLKAGRNGNTGAPAAAVGSSRRRAAERQIGNRLSRLRRELEMTLTAAARKAGVSPSFLSAIERGRARPSVATFQKLAQLYKTNVVSFFGEPDEGRRLVRPRDRKMLQPHPGIKIEQLAAGDTMMEVQLWRIAPGASSGGSYHHEGEEFIFMLFGTLEIWLDDIERYVVQPGDSLYFESTHAHRWSNPSSAEAVLLWVNTPPSF